LQGPTHIHPIHTSTPAPWPLCCSSDPPTSLIPELYIAAPSSWTSSALQIVTLFVPCPA
jgi:hypothetical protein